MGGSREEDTGVGGRRHRGGGKKTGVGGRRHRGGGKKTQGWGEEDTEKVSAKRELRFIYAFEITMMGCM